MFTYHRIWGAPVSTPIKILDSGPHGPDVFLEFIIITLATRFRQTVVVVAVCVKMWFCNFICNFATHHVRRLNLHIHNTCSHFSLLLVPDYFLDIFMKTPHKQCLAMMTSSNGFSALLAICAGNSPVNGEFPAQRPMTWNFDVFFDLWVNKHLSKQLRRWWFETLSRLLWRHCNDYLDFSIIVNNSLPLNIKTDYVSRRSLLPFNCNGDNYIGPVWCASVDNEAMKELVSI